jgi:pimeloyl-ACP methyl ester carboxylesterase
MALSEPIERWRRRGAYVHVRDVDVFYVMEGSGPTLVVLHGFPTSSYDWSAAFSGLTAHHRVVLVDLPGFGLSGKPKIYSYSLLEQTDVLLDVCNRLDVREAHVAAHDMGTSIACELVARRESGGLPFSLQSLTLMNGSVHFEMARLTASQRALRRPLLGRVFARLSSRTTFKLQFRRLFGRADAVPDDELDRLWELVRYNDGVARMPQIIRYVEERQQRAPRWVPPLSRLDIPSLILWGRRDPVSVYAIAERLAAEVPNSRLVTLEGLGHYPQMEDPARVSDAIGTFIAGTTARPSVVPAAPR